MRIDAASALIAMGHKLDIDFVASEDEHGALHIKWLSKGLMPSDAEIEAFDMAKVDIKRQIVDLEKQVTQRMLREAALGIDRKRLQAIEDEIAGMRAQL